ncbi:CKLF-like MARVEL transmembrane domain-containing protein 6 [Aulostomus maculatus]
MATGEVYSSTTAPNPKSSWFLGPSEHLGKFRLIIKVLEVVLSFVAFILEEVVNSCISCSALYFFEFVSCTAFLFTLLLLFLLTTTLHKRIGISCWPQLDFLYTGSMAALFLIASCVFASYNSNMDVEKTAVAFGFLATAAFIFDVVLFWKNSGFPFSADGKEEPGNGVPAAAVAIPAETERLNTQAE